MGVNWQGEMELLVSILKPHAGVITNIGSAHSGLLGGREGIFIEKGNLLEGIDPQGKLPRAQGFVFEGEPRLSELRRRCPGDVVLFGKNSTRGFAGACSLGLKGWTIEYNGLTINFKGPGEYNLLNALCAMQVAGEFGASPRAVKEGLESFEPLAGRGQVFTGDVTVYEDSYNANPDSMDKTMRMVQGLGPGGKVVMVLGSMRELGKDTESAHRELGIKTAEAGGNAVFLFGEEMKATADILKPPFFQGHAAHYIDYRSLEEALIDYAVRERLNENDLIVLKGSRLMKLERLVPVLLNYRNPKGPKGDKEAETC